MKIETREEMIEAAGMRIAICMHAESEDQEWQSTVAAGFWIGIILSGSIETSGSKIEKQVWKVNTKHAFWSDGSLVMDHKISSCSEPFAAIFIHLADAFSNDMFDKDELNMLQLRKDIPLLLKSTSIERTLAWRILGAKSNGLEKKLYVTSRAIDLVSSVVSAFYQGHKKSLDADTLTKLSPSEIERIYILSNNLMAEPGKVPPTDVLAREVGMNVRKINSGFRALFGVTMYGFIIQSRLEKARALLEAGEQNVSQVAYSVGYDPAHFSTAFRKRFGLPPSAFSKLVDR